MSQFFDKYNPLSRKSKAKSQIKEPLMQSYGGSDQFAFEGGTKAFGKSSVHQGSLLTSDVDLSPISENKELTKEMVDIVYKEFHSKIICLGAKGCTMKLKQTFKLDKAIEASFKCSRCQKKGVTIAEDIKMIREDPIKSAGLCETSTLVCDCPMEYCPLCVQKLRHSENEEDRRKQAITAILGEIAGTQREVTGVDDMEEHLTSEPKTKRAKCRSVTQNMYEIEAALAIIFIAYAHESIMACGFVLSTNALLYTATMERLDRIKYGSWCLYSLITAVLVLMILKVARATYINVVQEVEVSLDNCFDIIAFNNRWVAWGYNENIISGWVPVDGWVSSDVTRSIPKMADFNVDQTSAAEFSLGLDGLEYYVHSSPCKFLVGKGDEFMQENTPPSLIKSPFDPSETALGLKFSVQIWDSVNFEFGALIVLIISLFRLKSVSYRLNKLRKNYAKVVMVKNYEVQRLCGSLDSDNEEQKATTKENKNVIKNKKKEKEDYIEAMNKLVKSLPLVYIDCHHFKGLNKICFLWLMVFQLMQTLGCPGLFDIPQMIMILLVVSVYAFRKSIPVFFGFLNISLAYWIQIGLMFKLCLGICLNTAFIKDYFEHNKEGMISQLMPPLFGSFNFEPDDKTMKMTYFFSLYACIYLSQLWKQAKWAEIRNFIKGIDQKENSQIQKEPQFLQCLKYFSLKVEQEKSLSVLETLREESKVFAKSQKDSKSGKNNKILKQGTDLIGKARDELNHFMPTVVIWMIRILMGFQCYLYHTQLNMFHLSYVLLTFIFTGQLANFVGAVIILPIYLGEFIITFGLEIDKIKDTRLIQKYGEQFSDIAWRKNCTAQEGTPEYDSQIVNDKCCTYEDPCVTGLNFRYPIFEQLLYFMIVALLCASISCYKISVDIDQNAKFVQIFKDKIKDKNSNILYNVMFFLLRHIQSVVLLALFVRGREDLNSLRNLGFMIFFVVYTASEALYRKTQKVLVIFLSGFILGQYYYSLVYLRYTENPIQEARFKWMSFYEEESKPTWTKWDPHYTVYFRHTPYAFDWIVLLIMCGLGFVNNLFSKKTENETLEALAFENLRNRYPYTMFTLLRITNYCSQWAIILVICTMFYYICHADSNLVNWIFFIANIINFSFVAKGDNKFNTNKKSKICSDFITFYSAAMLLTNILFILAVGQNPKPDQPQSMDRRFKDKFPTIYDNLDIIGLRWHVPQSIQRESQSEEELDNERESAFQAKFFSYIVYLMVSLYLSSYFNSKMKTSKTNESLTEENYTRLFMYKQRGEYDKLREEEKKIQKQKLMNATVEEDCKIKQEANENYTFWRKNYYSELDIKQAYEDIRYEPFFLSYQWIEWWPTFDTLASYGHFFNNALIVYISIAWSTNFFMAFNVICVCCYYSIATYKLSKRAFECYTDSGLQSQTDIKSAKMITKKYKKGAFFEFLDIRHKLWKLQFFVLVLVSSIAFGSTILQLVREKCQIYDPDAQDFRPKSSSDEVGYDDSKCSDRIRNINDIEFYLFMFGMYKPIDSGLRSDFYKPIFCLTVGFLLERQCINWLTNRSGLTYNKLQKVIELELRKQAIEEKWPNQPPRYNPQLYQHNYFGQDFDDLLTRFSETEIEGDKRRKTMRDAEKEVRDFVPYKVAKRIQSLITFSVKLQGQSPDLQLDDVSVDFLNQIDSQFDKHEREQRELNKNPQIVSLKGNTYKDILGEYQSLDFLDTFMKKNVLCEYNKKPIWQRVKQSQKKNGSFEVPEKLYRRYALYEGGQMGWIIIDSNQYENLSKDSKISDLQAIVQSKGKTTYEWDRVKNSEQFKGKNQEGVLFQYSKFEESGCYVQVHMKEFTSTMDHESIPVLRDNKIKFYEQLLVDAVDFKYKVSFYKGIQFVFETLILLILMLSMILKSNFISIIYFLFLLKYLVSRSKTRLIIFMAQFISIAFSAQYIMYVMNMTHHTSPLPYPKEISNYPSPASSKIKYLFPFFFRYNVFHDLRMAYLVGIGFEKSQIFNILLDFFNLYAVSMYILHYRNPILVKSMEKLFWRFPSKYEEAKKWARLDPIVKKQACWMYDPIPYDSPHYMNLSKKLGSKEKMFDPRNKNEIKRAELQFKFASDYNKNNYLDLDQVLIDYIDLKYDTIWSDKQCNQVKKNFKQQSIFYRLVKQGSLLVYLCLHIFTVFLILLMAACRQSFIAIGYVIIILPHMKACAQVLIQKNLDQNSQFDELFKKKEVLTQTLADEMKANKQSPQYKELESEMATVKQEIQDLTIKLSKEQSSMSSEEKMQMRQQSSSKNWQVINVIKFHLMIYAMLDFAIQVVYQMPIPFMIQSTTFFGIELDQLGIRKTWHKQNLSGDEAKPFSYNEFINHNCEENLSGFNGQTLDTHNLGLQFFNCILICVLSLQTEIFESYGYQKFVTKKDGMELLIKSAKKKAHSIAYTINNAKLQKVFSIQRRREVIDETVEVLKSKINNWRRFTQKVLNAKSSKLDSIEAEAQADSGIRKLESESSPLKNSKSAQVPATQSLVKKVVFQEDQKKDQVEEETENYKSTKTKLSEQETDKFIQELAKAFILEKISVLNTRSQIYLWLNQSYVELIMFKNDEQNLNKIFDAHLKGQVSTPTELEQIMEDEAQFQIKKLYDNKQGAMELLAIQRQYTSKGGGSGKELLERTGLSKKIKLRQLSRVWSFTRASTMRFHLFETLIYMIISNTQPLIYFFMIASMYTNAGLISLPYPIAVFGYALLEETRPRYEFWGWVRNYTVALLAFKFAANLSILEEFFGSEAFKYAQAWLRLGIYDYDNILDLTWYMLPEIIIICLIMLNEIQLNLLGLYYQTEQDIETITDGQERLLAGGDQDVVKRKKVFNANMAMFRYFEPRSVQEELNKKHLERQMKEQNVDEKLDPKEFQKEQDAKDGFKTQKDKQTHTLKEISEDIWKSSREFDIDSSANATDSVFDRLVKENIIQKSLESDDLLIVDGEKATDFEYASAEKLENDLHDDRMLDSMSCGDFEEEYHEKIEFIEKKDEPKLSKFEKSQYFQRLFPTLKIQKPGKDYYAGSTLFLGILGVYIGFYYGMISVDKTTLIESVKNSNKLFMGEMALCLVAVMSLIVVERYINRSDTKKNTQQGIEMGEQKSYVNKDKMFNRSSTSRSMTVSLRTMKTSDIDMSQDESVKDFFQDLMDDMQGGGGLLTKTKITQQQKCKFYLHWVMLILIHVFVFWYIPITGNKTLFDSPLCPENRSSTQQYLVCRSFHTNPYLRLFYVILLGYLMMSGLQIKSGMPIQKIASSVCVYYNDGANALSKVYVMIPFAMEVRCVLDFCFSKTALDIFQVWQLFQYHLDLYQAKCDNIFYTLKTLGTQYPLSEKLTSGLGLPLMIFYLGILIAPVLIFSDYGYFITENPVKGAQIDVSFIVSDEVNSTDLDSAPEINHFMGVDDSYIVVSQSTTNDTKKVKQSAQFQIYSNEFPLIREFDKNYFEWKGYDERTETKEFNANQFQEVVASEYSDNSWTISRGNKVKFAEQLRNAVDPSTSAQFEMLFDYKFNRELPAQNQTTSGSESKQLDMEDYYDCKTAQDIKKTIKLVENQVLEDGSHACSGGDDLNPVSSTIRFYEAFYPIIVLGPDQNAAKIKFRSDQFLHEQNQKHDLLMKYSCNNAGDGEWFLYSSARATAIPKEFFGDGDDYQKIIVNSTTCEIAEESLELFEELMSKSSGATELQRAQNYSREIHFGEDFFADDKVGKDGSSSFDEHRSVDDTTWSRLTFTVLSMIVSSSFFSGYSVSAFYTGFVIVLAPKIKLALISSYYINWQYEQTHTDPLIKLIEAVYIHRHEEDLIGEEECYRMLVEVCRSPELLKLLSGASTKGDCDPLLDRLNKKDIEKLKHLDRLERLDKGFDVEKLRTEITEKANQKAKSQL